MERIVKYRSSDGCEFVDADACERYERLCSAVRDAMSLIGDKPDLPHGTFIQQDREACMACKRAMLQIVRKRLGDHWEVLKNNSDDDIHPSSFVGRLVDDSGIKCLGEAWWRLMRINWDNFCEYDQPYFANNPGEATAA